MSRSSPLASSSETARCCTRTAKAVRASDGRSEAKGPGFALTPARSRICGRFRVLAIAMSLAMTLTEEAHALNAGIHRRDFRPRVARLRIPDWPSHKRAPHERREGANPVRPAHTSSSLSASRRSPDRYEGPRPFCAPSFFRFWSTSPLYSDCVSVSPVASLISVVLLSVPFVHADTFLMSACRSDNS